MCVTAKGSPVGRAGTLLLLCVGAVEFLYVVLFLHRLGANGTCSISGGLRASFQSPDTNAEAGQNA